MASRAERGDCAVQKKIIVSSRRLTHPIHGFDEVAQTLMGSRVWDPNLGLIIQHAEAHCPVPGSRRVDHAWPEVPRERFRDERHRFIVAVLGLHGHVRSKHGDRRALVGGGTSIREAKLSGRRSRFVARQRLRNVADHPTPPVTTGVRTTRKVEVVAQRTRHESSLQGSIGRRA